MVIEHPKTAIVTGATGAIGFAIASGIARSQGFQVVLVCRDEERRLETRSRRFDETPATNRFATRSPIFAEPEKFELACRSLAVRTSTCWSTTQPSRHHAGMTTPDGLELQFATNVMSYVWMMEAFRERPPTHCRPARVVNVASYWAGRSGTCLDLQFERRRYDNATKPIGSPSRPTGC